MKGEFLRERLKNIEFEGKKINLTDLAEKLGKTPQALNSKLNAQYIKDDFLQEIADALNIDVKLLSQPETYASEALDTITAEPNSPYTNMNNQEKYIYVLEKNQILSEKLIAQLENNMSLYQQLTDCFHENAALKRAQDQVKGNA